MKILGNILMGLGCLWLIGMLVFGAGTSWFMAHPDKVPVIGGIEERASQQVCAEKRAELDSLWNEAVKNGTIAAAMDELSSQRRVIEADCANGGKSAN